eukprot:TRINITY_DN16653_c0_g1_i1.p1 TRINITY_DN16653_c0_g1~~TRINITY_DN16653_c0_g1_i1.p1  ORF type:complete len:105 (+),score=7.98 TRINITY_DN16653_c0_g1_i1:483-797(+)
MSSLCHSTLNTPTCTVQWSSLTRHFPCFVVEFITVSGNQLTSVPVEICRLTNLTMLNCVQTHTHPRTCSRFHSFICSRCVTYNSARTFFLPPAQPHSPRSLLCC